MKTKCIEAIAKIAKAQKCTVGKWMLFIKPQDGDEYGQLFQAAAYEAIFQQVADRPFMVGSFSWAFDYVGAWQFDTASVRDRAAGAVMAKWYERLAGRPAIP